MKRKRLKKIVFELVGSFQHKSVEKYVNNSLERAYSKTTFEQTKTN